jgi:hypothetical protein
MAHKIKSTFQVKDFNEGDTLEHKNFHLLSIYPGAPDAIKQFFPAWATQLVSKMADSLDPIPLQGRKPAN